MASGRTSVGDSSACIRSRHWKPRNKGIENLVTLLLLIMQLNHASTAPVNSKNSWRNVTIINKEGKYLAITRTGVTGEDNESTYSKLQLRSVGLYGEVTIRGVKVNKFIAMKNNGQVYLAKTATNESVFIDGYVSGNLPFRSFCSKLYSSNYLAISTTGMVKNTVNHNSNDMQFAVLQV